MCVREICHKWGTQAVDTQGRARLHTGSTFGKLWTRSNVCMSSVLQVFSKSKFISNHSHSFCLGLIFTQCSIFLSHISALRSDYNFSVKSQLFYCQTKTVLVTSGWELAFVSEEERSVDKVSAHSFLLYGSIVANSTLIFFFLIDFLPSSKHTLTPVWPHRIALELSRSRLNSLLPFLFQLLCS